MSAVTVSTRGAALVAAGWGWTPAGRDAPAVDQVDLRIGPGERVLLLGASGSGKSTLLQGWAGVLGGADEGLVTGVLRVDDAAPDERRGRVGLLLQDPDAQLVHARVRDDVGFGPENLGVPAARIDERVDTALAAVGLGPAGAVGPDADGGRLSGGQRQRLALAGLLALEPAALLLDEPTAQLDPAGAAQVVAAVAELVRERALTLVVVEHRVDLWLPHVDRVVVLDRGRVVADGPAGVVLGQRGAELARSGVWIPGREAEHPSPRAATIAPDAPVLLRARGLDGRPAGGDPLGHALDLDLRAGEVVALTGPNGAGKSTLLMTLAGLLPPAAGALEALDHGAPADWSSRALAARFGVVFQNPEHQFVAPTVRDELAVGAPQHSDASRMAARVDALLDRLGLRGLAPVSPYALSGGEQRRLSVATALAADPPVLLLDEPTFGQDSRTWAALVALIAEHRDAGGAVVMATHDRALIAALGAREIAVPALDRRAVRAPAPSAATARPPLGERLNPVAAIAASLLPALLLVTTIDVTSAAVALGLQLLLIPALGIPLGRVLRRAVPVLVAAPFAALTIALYGRESGRVYAEFLLVRISDGSLELALATLLRILAIALPAIALFTRPDPTRLGDALGQNLRLPSRFVLGSVAALRLMTVLGDDARTVERAQRARGLGDRSRLRRLGGQVFGLLVLAIRRGSALAVGMEARGFGAPGPRTWWRPSPWRASDAAVVVIAVAVAALGVAAAVLTGSFTSALG
ncbi:ATP-binding cassette domain-containing protein [Microcella frigidaquae]|uniref:Energy-coupling factor transport system ATP-binding protein n=1 Tax=Microcella frigidaquae TaxID=424758 RepID=A0A840XKS4_9MICO|nr:energy-coupling factor transport system ATP-binding protein [Microcella frigidaquae]NHN45043.1 ATP-binding cassette domain-containing protein [Microcella frigidaquae]